MYKGKKVFITALEKEDLPLLMEWRNNPNYRKFFREYRELNLDMQENWYREKVLKDSSTLMFSIKDTETGNLIGCCGLCYINWVHRNADLSLYIGLDNCYIDDSGLAKESCRLLFDYGFKELGLERIWTEIYEFDCKKYNLYTGLGFQKEGELRHQYFYDGKWWNSYLMALLKDEWLL